MSSTIAVSSPGHRVSTASPLWLEPFAGSFGLLEYLSPHLRPELDDSPISLPSTSIQLRRAVLVKRLHPLQRPNCRSIDAIQAPPSRAPRG